MPIQPPVTAEQNETEAVRPDEYQPSDVGPKPAGRAKLLIVAVLLVLITAGAVTFLNRKSETDALAKETEAVSIPTVAVVQPQAEPGNDELVLPGNLQAFIESPIFARTNGYLLRWYKDIGSKVEKGELLAAIDTPEVDQELSQARASREQIKAALGLAKISADRWANLLKSDSVSQQEADQQASGYQQALANLAAADANVRRLEELESFKNVYAPFSGVLTRRNVDPGALINSGAPDDIREQFKAWCTRRLKEMEQERGCTTAAADPDACLRIRQNWWAERGSGLYVNDEDALKGIIHYVREAQDGPRRV